MIKLTEISQIDFEKYKAIFIEEETSELIENYKYPIEVSKDKAIKEFDKCFPDGKTQENECLLSIKPAQLDTDKILGYLWYSISDDYIFILDFYIKSEFRGQSYGTQTLEELQKIAIDKNIQQVRLRVAHTNNRALKLYQELGFSITGTNMVKWF
jgi:ribosomal protein S18 acetylase RimI-like enzyme